MKLTSFRKLYITCFILLLLVVVLGNAYAGAARNVILMIGDGMSYQHVNAASYYLNGTAGTLCFEPYHKCSVTTNCLDYTVHPITDSAAAASAIATGHKVNYLAISQSPTGTPYQTILELAKTMGKRVGFVGTDPITRATPAAFGAHDPNRNNLIAIGDDYLNSSQPDVMMGGGGTAAGGSSFFSTAQISIARSLGYQIVHTSAQMNALSPSTSRVLGLFSTNDMTYEYDRPVNTTEPHLSEMTAKALSLLDTDPDGFFLMVEGAKIDYAAHANDIIRTTREVVEFNNSVQVVLNWMQGRTDTLLIVTGDHETGGLTAVNRGKGDYPGATWSSTDHTAANVPLYVYGANAGLVDDYIHNGVIDNTDIFRLMRRAYASDLGTAPYLIYQQFGIGTGGSGNIYYGGGVFDGTFYTGQITQCAQQWGDEQINGTALMNTTAIGWAPPSTDLVPEEGASPAPANLAKASVPLAGYIYMSNGAGTLYRTSSWSSTPVQVYTPIVAESICTDGVHIFMSSGTSSHYNKIHKWIVNHTAGTVTEAAGWPVTIGTTTTVRFRGISYYNGKLYLANFRKTGEIYEVDANTGAVTQIAALPTSADSFYQAVRYGNKIFIVALDGNLYTFTVSGTTWTLSSTDALGFPEVECYGIGVKGDGTNARYAWITNKPGQISFFTLDPPASGSLGDARKVKNGYPVTVQNAVVTKAGAGEFWVEDKDRAAGVRVVWSGAVPALNTLVTMTGCMNTTDSGEKFFTPTAVIPDGHYALKPLFTANRNLGTATGSAGLANDGMLVTIFGRVTYFDAGTMAIYINDGSDVPSGIGSVKGVKVTAADMQSVPGFWDLINSSPTPPYPYLAVVTGVVRLEKLGDGTIIRRIDSRTDADIILTPLP